MSKIKIYIPFEVSNPDGKFDALGNYFWPAFEFQNQNFYLAPLI
jgi:hypothetical protein